MKGDKLTIADIAPITAGDVQVRVELAAGSVFIHVSPHAICSHCGHQACIFIALDGWSPCARCYNTLQLYAEKKATLETNRAETMLAAGAADLAEIAGKLAEEMLLARPFLVMEKAVQA
jgi:hypothetical protein